MKQELVNHPNHYRGIPGCPEVIELIRGMRFREGNVIKYLMRAPFKGNLKRDVEKARWYWKDILGTQFKSPFWDCGLGWLVNKDVLAAAINALEKRVQVKREEGRQLRLASVLEAVRDYLLTVEDINEHLKFKHAHVCRIDEVFLRLEDIINEGNENEE